MCASAPSVSLAMPPAANDKIPISGNSHALHAVCTVSAMTGGFIDERVEGAVGLRLEGTMQRPAPGPSVSDDKEENLQEDARETNSNLQRLIEVIGGLLAVSGDLLVRLQHILGGGVQSAADQSNGADDPGQSPPTDRSDR
jgi:hypothetical protein